MQAIGPVAITSLLLMNGVGGLVPAADVNVDPNNPADPAAQRLYNDVALQVSLLVGAMTGALGLLRLGFLTNFLSRSVISGFTTGAAIVIGVSQVPPPCPPSWSTLCTKHQQRLLPQNMASMSMAPQWQASCPTSSQVKLLVGFHIPRHQRIFKTLGYLVRNIRRTRPLELAMGLTWLALLLSIKKAGTRHK